MDDRLPVDGLLRIGIDPDGVGSDHRRVLVSTPNEAHPRPHRLTGGRVTKKGLVADI
jgi:hypothetical protein